MGDQPGADEKRPDPDEFLRLLHRQEPDTGRLKIFFGYAAGVGKTYAMLTETRSRIASGVDAIIGYVEPHSRPDTLALLDGLEAMAPLSLTYRGIELKDFDLDAALARKPALVIVDELAHTNAPGKRHAKRWQDVKELLDHGIDVYTTLNVQHIESLNDVVAAITGISARETIPDSLFDEAAVIELVDIPSEELLERFRDGKIYLPERAEKAMQSFFRAPKLDALREVALRRAAEKLNVTVQEGRGAGPDKAVWPTTETLVVCVGSNPSSATVIRRARRMAASLKARWVALHVRTNVRSLRGREPQALYRNLQLAESLGAEVVTLDTETGSVPDSIVRYARLRNATKIVIGKNFSTLRWLRHIRGDLVDRLLHATEDIDVYVIPGERQPSRRPRRVLSDVRAFLWDWRAILETLGIMGAATLVALGIRAVGAALPNVIMVLLLGVVVVSVRRGQAAGIAASATGVLVFNFLFTAPYYTFAIADTQYVITFFVMLVVAVLLSTLTARVKEQYLLSQRREWRSDALHRLSRTLSRTTGRQSILQVSSEVLEGLLPAEIALYVGRDQGMVRIGRMGAAQVDSHEQAVVQWVLDNRSPAGAGTDTLSASERLYLPLVGGAGIVGALGALFRERTDSYSPEYRTLIEACASQIALALEREDLSEKSHLASTQAEQERLRSSLLRSISHDLRTPLAGITGSASVLLRGCAESADPQERQLLETIIDEATWLVRMVENLLNLTRFETPGVVLHTQLESADDIISSALAALSSRLKGYALSVRLPDEVLMVPVEGMLVQQVLVNVLDNAFKYSPEGSPIDIAVESSGKEAVFEIADRGRGIPAGEEERIFEKFRRSSDAPKEVRGAGLGLSICRAIVEAHGGWIRARPREGGGTRVMFGLPLSPSGPRANE